MKAEDIDADLEVLFFTSYLPELEATLFDPKLHDDAPIQFEEFVMDAYKDDPDYEDPETKELLLEQAGKFLLRFDISIHILQGLLDKYLSLQKEEMDERIPFLAFVVAQAQNFDQLGDEEGLIDFIDNANVFIKNIDLYCRDRRKCAQFKKSYMFRDRDQVAATINALKELIEPQSSEQGSHKRSRQMVEVDQSLIEYAKVALEFLEEYQFTKKTTRPRRS